MQLFGLLFSVLATHVEDGAPVPRGLPQAISFRDIRIEDWASSTYASIFGSLRPLEDAAPLARLSCNRPGILRRREVDPFSSAVPTRRAAP